MLDRPTFTRTFDDVPFTCAGDDMLDLSERVLVCVTGTRRATPYGFALARESGRLVADAGLVLLTSAALGCAAEAARAALDAGGEVVLVSATGCNYPYPNTSRDIYERATLVVSLVGCDGTVTRKSFVDRNHALAKLASALVVCEAGVPSGVFTLAEEVAAQDKAVLAYPGSVFSPTSQGTNRLIAERIASPLASPADLAKDFDIPQAPFVPNRPSDALSAALMASPMRADELSRSLDENVLDVLRNLADLERDGRIERLPDGRYAWRP